MELRNPWTFASRLLSNESHGKQRENGYFYLSVAFKRAQLFSFFFSLSFHLLLSLDVSPFSRAVYARQEFLFPIRFAECTRLYEAHNGKRRFNASLADNRFEYQQLRTLISPCMDPRFEPTHGARPMGLTFPITGRLGFWKTPAPLPRVAWPRTWCTSRQDAPARTCRAFCDSGRSECAAGTCTTATWCEVSSNSLQTEIRAVTDRSSIVRKIWEKKYRVSPKNFHGKRARVTFDYIINARGETDKEKQKKKLKLETRQFFLNANIYIYIRL